MGWRAAPACRGRRGGEGGEGGALPPRRSEAAQGLLAHADGMSGRCITACRHAVGCSRAPW